MRSEVEEILGKCFPVLNDGFVMLVDVMGSDEDIEQAARISYGEGTRAVNKTRGLLRYLMRHKHSTPFEMVELKFCIRVPMDCWRQWIRHRTANVNEYSTRYSEAIDSRQTTSPNEWRSQDGGNKQGSSGFLSIESVEQGDPGGNQLSVAEFKHHQYTQNLYETRLRVGVAREQARKDLPLSTYTMAYWKCDLHNIFHFLNLRCDSHAQKEIRDYAVVMAGIVKRVVPLAFEAWVDYTFGASNWTLLDKQMISHILEYEIIGGKEDQRWKDFAKEINMSNREYEEFWQKLQLPEIPDFDLDLSKTEDFSKWRQNED